MLFPVSRSRLLLRTIRRCTRVRFQPRSSVHVAASRSTKLVRRVYSTFSIETFHPEYRVRLDVQLIIVFYFHRWFVIFMGNV